MMAICFILIYVIIFSYFFYPELLSTLSKKQFPIKLLFFDGGLPLTPTIHTDNYSLQEGRIIKPTDSLTIRGLSMYYDSSINAEKKYTGNLWSTSTRSLLGSVSFPMLTSVENKWLTIMFSNSVFLLKDEEYIISLSYILGNGKTIFNAGLNKFIPYTNNNVILGRRVVSTTTGYPNMVESADLSQNIIIAMDISI